MMIAMDHPPKWNYGGLFSCKLVLTSWERHRLADHLTLIVIERGNG
jgi:hypothetical protein